MVMVVDLGESCLLVRVLRDPYTMHMLPLEIGLVEAKADVNIQFLKCSQLYVDYQITTIEGIMEL